MLFKIKYCLVARGGKLDARIINSRKLSNIIFKNSRKNITPSKYLYQIFNNLNFKIAYIPNFIDIKEYEFYERTILKPNLLWVRSIHDLYNPIMALKAIKILKEDYPKIRLTMIGPDKNNHLKKCTQYVLNNKLSHNVVFTGFMPKQDWIEKAKDHDIFMNTTNYESFGVSVIEASACGLPVVTTNVGELKYIFENEKNAILISKNDHVMLANKVKLLLENNSFAKQLSFEGRKNAERFDWINIKEEWNSFLNQII